MYSDGEGVALAVSIPAYVHRRGRCHRRGNKKEQERDILTS